jgi:DNA-directed RNA polymerase specialized sigma24 family protein
MGHRDWTSAHDSTDDERELQARIERELPQLPALARRLTCEEHDAQDAVQDALERAWRARHQFRDPAASGGWLRSILAGTVIDCHRRRADLTTADPQVLDLLIPEFIEMIADSGTGLYACQASVDLFGLTKDDFIPQVQDIITVGEFYGLAAGGQIIFT